jgi:hypothetical protein
VKQRRASAKKNLFIEKEEKRILMRKEEARQKEGKAVEGNKGILSVVKKQE